MGEDALDSNFTISSASSLIKRPGLIRIRRGKIGNARLFLRKRMTILHGNKSVQNPRQMVAFKNVSLSHMGVPASIPI